MKKVTKFNVIDHGIEHTQYFEGCGIAYTEFEDVATGIGDTPLEAFEDALEQLAEKGWDVDTLEKELLEEVDYFSQEIEEELADCEKEGLEDCEDVYWHISIQVKGE